MGVLVRRKGRGEGFVMWEFPPLFFLFFFVSPGVPELFGWSMPKLVWGVGFLRWGGDMGYGDTDRPLPNPKKGPFQPHLSGSSPGRSVRLSCLPLNQDGCQAAY